MECMELHLRPDVQDRLDRLARETGRVPGELIEDAVVSYLDEFANLRETLDRRYDDLESGSVEAIDGEEAYRRLLQKNEALRRRSA
jgi:predicted transcriptional regulator